MNLKFSGAHVRSFLIRNWPVATQVSRCISRLLDFQIVRTICPLLYVHAAVLTCHLSLQTGDLIAELQQTAHMVAVMEQDVLMQAFGSAQVMVFECTCQLQSMNTCSVWIEHKSS